MKFNSTAVSRFWKYVRKTDFCWEWMGQRDRDGYGRFRPTSLDSDRTGSHRFSYELFNDVTLESGVLVCHSCDNPSCVNPQHLFVGTHQDNVNDMFNKNRENKARGGQFKRTKLQAADVLRIRRVYKKRIYTMKCLAEEYQVSVGSISGVLRRRSFRYLP
jgi:hypothetical protein